MTTPREAMRLALEALKSIHRATEYPEIQPAITALRAALEQPEQEPVAWMSQAGNFLSPLEFTTAEAALYGWTPVYTHPPQQQAEPVALIRDGVLRWHIPHEYYSRPKWTAHGTHMLYAHGIGEKP